MNMEINNSGAEDKNIANNHNTIKMAKITQINFFVIPLFMI